MSPRLTRPSASAGASASGIDAVEVLPHSSMLVSVRASGIPVRLQIASIMRRFALCGTNQSTSAALSSAIASSSPTPAEMFLSTHS